MIRKSWSWVLGAAVVLIASCSADEEGASQCGDGVVQLGEQCDDGNADATDACTPGCQLAACGDGIVQSPEECDDGNVLEHDGCTTSCRPAACRDGVVQPGEECDDGNVDDQDACTNGCTIATCGDGIVHTGVEACDDGNTSDDDSCSNTCALSSCGDGVVQPGEQCDDGNVSDADSCTTKCLNAHCGDGLVQTGVEECDDGNSDDHDDCLDDCTVASCGDGVVWLAVEECDDANSVDDDGCSNGCKLPSCGDGVMQPGEQCDDGNGSNADGCLATCQLAFCGDGFVHLGVEECDDANANDSDDCTNACQLASCGDGILQPPEQCDDGNGSNHDACLNTCHLAFCGDGFLQLGVEDCDDGNTFDTDACPSTCIPASCGDGFVWSGMEACDDGNTVPNDGCTNGCALPSCGDGLVQPGEECDDANADNTDGCLITCMAFDLCLGFGITDVAPSVACTGNTPAAVTLDASGYGFLVVEGQQPLVTFDGAPIPILSMATCTPIGGVLQNVLGCASMTVDIPDGLAVGNYTVAVENPITQTCTASITFSVGDAPQVTAVSPASHCAGQPLVFDVFGSGFTPASQVALEGTPATLVTFISAGHLQVTFPPLAPGLYDLTVSNGPACETTEPNAVSVMQPPFVFFVTPPLVWDGTNTPITVFATNVTLPVMDVSIKLTGSSNPPLSLSFSPAPGHPERPVAVVPAGLTPGDYDVTVTDAIGCWSTLTAAFHITGDTSLALLKVKPAFAAPVESTPVTVTASTTPPSTGFVGLPVVYLTGGVLQYPALFKSVAVNSPTSLSAVLPPGTPPGTYNLVVVNPNNTVGVLPASFTVMGMGEDPLPKITSVTPGLIGNTIAAQPITITGTGFNTPSVTFQCIDPQAAPFPDQVLTVTSATATTIDAVFNATLYGTGANCIVVVTNANSAEAEFSSVVVVTPQQNLTDFFAGPNLLTPRRGLGAVSGRASTAARYVYALAGDQGATPLATVETLGVDIFGLPATAFFEQRYQLATARTMIGAQAIGRFIYVVGGAAQVGVVASALGSVERAAVLDALFHPEDLDVDLELSQVDGVGAGIYYYRVAAIMNPSDPFNPGGETLPSAPFGVSLPSLPNNYKLRVALSWSPVTGAQGYRVYRSVSNAPAGNETLIADTTQPLPPTVTCTPTSCTDLGASAGTVAFLPSGSTGVWTTVGAALNVARQGAGVTTAVDPVDPTKVHLYVLGGLDAAGTTRSDYEYLTITVNPDGSQTPAPVFVTGATALTAPRWHLGGYSATQLDSSLLDGTYVWAGGGATAGGAMVPSFDGAKVAAGGALGTFTDTGPMNPQAAGYGAFAAGDYVYALGGQDGLPDVNNMSAEHSGTPPGLQNFQGFNPGLLIPRIDVGATVQSGYFYVLGGLTTGNVVTASTEYVLY